MIYDVTLVFPGVFVVFRYSASLPGCPVVPPLIRILLFPYVPLLGSLSEEIKFQWKNITLSKNQFHKQRN